MTSGLSCTCQVETCPCFAWLANQEVTLHKNTPNTAASLMLWYLQYGVICLKWSSILLVNWGWTWDVKKIKINLISKAYMIVIAHFYQFFLPSQNIRKNTFYTLTFSNSNSSSGTGQFWTQLSELKVWRWSHVWGANTLREATCRLDRVTFWLSACSLLLIELVDTLLIGVL